MNATMRQMVTTGPGEMRLDETPAPVPGPGDALVRVTAVGLCGSDYHLFDGSHPYARYPQVQGHEVVGVVATLPAGYQGERAVGDPVTIEPLVWCGRCMACRRGRTNCCVRLQVIGVHLPGGLAEFLTAPADRLHSIDAVPTVVAVLAEPVSIGVHAVARGAVSAGDRVVVLGAGPIGIAAMLAALDRGAMVLVADREPSRLGRAAALGALTTVDTSAADLAEATAGFTGGDGAAVVIDATGVPALVRLAVDLVAPGGTVVVVGISTDPVAIPVSEFSRKEISVVGSRNSAGEFAAAVELVRRRAVDLAPLITHEFPLAETAAAIEFARANPQDVEKAVIRVADTVDNGQRP